MLSPPPSTQHAALSTGHHGCITNVASPEKREDSYTKFSAETRPEHIGEIAPACAAVEPTAT